jgi:hypothetical protein
MKVCQICECEIDTKDGDNKCFTCENQTAIKAKARRKEAATRRKLHREVMESLGLVRVRGALGGVYFE